MPIHKLINNFTGGEISPQLDARSDLQKYDTSCRSLQNCRPLPWGGARMRSGTLGLAPAKFPTKVCRLIPFKFSTQDAAVLEVGDLYIRFYISGSQVGVIPGGQLAPKAWVSGTSYAAGTWVYYGSPAPQTFYCIAATSGTTAPSSDTAHWLQQNAYEIMSPYTDSEVFDLQFKQVNSVMYMCHPNYPVYQLSRTALGGPWTLAPLSWRYPPLLDQNTDGVTALSLSAISGSGVTMNANPPGWFTATYYQAGTTIQENATGTLLPYICLKAHTSSASFLVDLAAGLWQQTEIFDANHVGSFWELQQPNPASTVIMDISGSGGASTSAAITVVGDWTVTTTELWYGELDIQRSLDGGQTWTTIRSFTAKADRNVSASGTELVPLIGQPRVQLRMVYTAAGNPYGTPPWTGTPPNSYVAANATLECADAYVAGLVQVTGYTDPFNVTVTVLQPPVDTSETTLWSEGAFSAYRGYPTSVGLYEQRLLFSGTTYQPNTIYGSQVGDFLNFQFADADDGAIAYQIAAAQQNLVQWIADLFRLHVGTTGEEYMLSSGNTDEAITPSNVVVRKQSSYGSEAIPPVTIDNGLLFVQRQGLRLRDLREMSIYANPSDFVAPDIAILAEHLLTAGIVQMDFGRVPDPLVYCVVGDGSMAVMTYNREQNINAWAPFTTEGNFESIAVTPGSPADVAYVVVNRTGLASPGRWIEVFTAETDDKVNGVYMDMAATTTNTPPQAAAFTFAALAGTKVSVVADGQVISNPTDDPANAIVVGPSGGITLPIAATKVQIGLPYVAQVQPQKINMNIASGATDDRRKRPTALVIRFINTLGAKYGNVSAVDPSATAGTEWMDEIPFRDTSDAMDASPPLFTGDKEVPWNGPNDLQADIMISQTQPLPMTVLAITAKMEVFGE